jgi:hypothetical protein
VCRAAGPWLLPRRRLTAPLDAARVPNRRDSLRNCEANWAATADHVRRDLRAPRKRSGHEHPLGVGEGTPDQRTQLPRGAVPTTTSSDSRPSSPRLSGATPVLQRPICSACRLTRYECRRAEGMSPQGQGAKRRSGTSQLCDVRLMHCHGTLHRSDPSDLEIQFIFKQKRVWHYRGRIAQLRID